LIETYGGNSTAYPQITKLIATSCKTGARIEQLVQEIASQIDAILPIKDLWFFRTYTVENSSSSLSAQQCSKVDKYQSNKNSKP